MDISFVIPTLNSEKTLEACLASILAQRVPRHRFEIVIADGGSTDGTIALAQRMGVDRIVPNTLKTGEAGKTVGIEASSGDLIALVDSDNLLPADDWLERMLAPFGDGDVVASEPLAYTVRPEDPALTRYFALLGMNDPLCLFTGNYDRQCAITGKWTGLQVSQQDVGDYLKLTLTVETLPTIGANGFVFRRSLLQHVTWQPYFFDIDVVHQAVQAGYVHIAKVKVGIVHLYCASLSDFARKQKRRICDYLFFSQERQRTYPWSQRQRAGVIRFVVMTVLILPVVAQAVVGSCRRRDRAWLYHLPVCCLTLWIYSVGALRKGLGLRQAPVARESWQAIKPGSQ